MGFTSLCIAMCVCVKKKEKKKRERKEAENYSMCIIFIKKTFEVQL